MRVWFRKDLCEALWRNEKRCRAMLWDFAGFLPWAILRRNQKQWKMRVFRTSICKIRSFSKIRCGHYGRYTWALYQNAKKTENLQKFAIFENWLWALWALWALCQKVENNWNLQNLQFLKIGCGHYGRYGRYAKRLKITEICKICNFSKLVVGTMGAMGAMPKGWK